MMKEWSQLAVTAFLPRNLKSLKVVKTQVEVDIADVTRYAVAFLAAFLVLFVSFYVLLLTRFNPDKRSFDLPGWFLIGLMSWGIVSAVVYLGGNQRKAGLLAIPGLLAGGAFFLALISYSFESHFPGIIFNTHLAVYLTMLTTYGFQSSGVLKKYKNLEAILIAFGSFLMYLVMLAAMLAFSASKYHRSTLPEWMQLLFDFDLRVILVSAVVIILMSIVSLFHFEIVEEYCQRGTDRIQRIHLAANVIFIAFMLYMAFIFFFGAIQKKLRG